MFGEMVSTDELRLENLALKGRLQPTGSPANFDDD